MYIRRKMVAKHPTHKQREKERERDHISQNSVDLAFDKTTHDISLPLFDLISGEAYFSTVYFFNIFSCNFRTSIL